MKETVDYPTSTPKTLTRRRVFRVLACGLLICFCLTLLYFPVAEIRVDDPNHTATTLRYYRASVIGVPVHGVDYSGERVRYGDKRLRFRGPTGRTGFIVKTYEIEENPPTISRTLEPFPVWW